MTILASDIKLLQSERMRDTDDGGGRTTGVEIVSGQLGNIHPKLSRADVVAGRVQLRKVVAAVRSANNDTYAGAHMIVSDPPDNPRVGILLFEGDEFDQVSAARNRIESYVVAGPLSRMRLYGTQQAGQMAILVYQLESEPLPDVGEVIVLSQESGGTVTASQYVRITDISSEVRTFTEGAASFSRRLLTLSVGTRLEQAFVANDVTSGSDTSATRIRTTQVADAAQYYGIQPLTEAAAAGDYAVQLASIYAPIVPSATRETAVSLASVAGATYSSAAASGAIAFGLVGSLTANWTGGAISPPISLLLPGRPKQVTGGNIRIALASGLAAKDNGAGSIVADANYYVAGAVNYETGVCLLSSFYAGGNPLQAFGSPTVTFQPLVDTSAPAHTRQIPITLSTRGSVYAQTLAPLPAPGTLIIDFRALGKWYRLRDNGEGVLAGNSAAEGSGSVDYATGATIITLGALPDVDSSIILSWGSPVHTVVRAGATADAGTTLDLEYTLAHAPIVPGTHVITWVVNSANRTATDSNGAYTGTGMTGTINYATGLVRLSFSTPPDLSSLISNAYTWRSGADLYGTATSAVISGGQFTVPGNAPFRNAGTLTLHTTLPDGTGLSLPGYITSGGQVRVRHVRGSMASGNSTGNPYVVADQAVGTIVAATGVVTLSPGTVGVTYQRWVPAAGLQGAYWESLSAAITLESVSDILVERDTAAFDPNAITGETLAPGTVGLTLDLTTTVADSIVPGSVYFTLTGKSYVDRNGTLYADVSPTTGSGTAAGSINYETGLCTLTYWANNAAVSRSILACLTLRGEWTAYDSFFRTSGSPIRPASLYVQVTATDGTLLTGTADTNGVITGPKMRGDVQQDMGVVAVEFGEVVESEWVPIEVVPGTLRYNCVVISALPLDPELIGLDPVRLPSDGRVPIFRAGDMVVLHNTADFTIANPVAASTTYPLPRGDLYSCLLLDATGAEVDSALYSVDLVVGEVTMDAAWTGTGYTQPLKARHRVEEMGMLSDAAINGQVNLVGSLLHDYPADTSWLSGALRYGDLSAIVTNVFDQATWSGAWSDTLIGSQATAQFDSINYPITLLNENAVTERWRINFTSSTAFQVIGENLGVIATGATNAATTPINPVTGDPYFNIPSAGWGSGWATGNQLRFNTQGATGPTWIIRTTLAGAALSGDSYTIEPRGDVD